MSGRAAHILTLSARTEAALAELAQRYVAFLDAHPEVNLAGLCYTTNTGRAHWPRRLAIVTLERGQLRRQLTDYLQGSVSPGVIAAGADRSGPDAAPDAGEPGGQSPVSKYPDTETEAGSEAARDAAARYVRGESVRWDALAGANRRRLPGLPTYPFQRVPCRLD
jgi:acyl transferase domain-containing protein